METNYMGWRVEKQNGSSIAKAVKAYTHEALALLQCRFSRRGH